MTVDQELEYRFQRLLDGLGEIRALVEVIDPSTGASNLDSYVLDKFDGLADELTALEVYLEDLTNRDKKDADEIPGVGGL